MGVLQLQDAAKHTTFREIFPGRDAAQLRRKRQCIEEFLAGRVHEALRVIRGVLSEPMSPPVAGECYTAEAACLSRLGDFQEAKASLNMAAPHIDQTEIYIQACFFNQRGRVHRNLGDLDAAITDYSGSAVLYEEAGYMIHVGIVANNLAWLYLNTEDIEQARASIDRALSIYDTMGSDLLSQAIDTNANVLLAEGRVGAALEEIERALNLSGSNELWKKEFQATKEKIKTEIERLLVPLLTVKDLHRLEIDIIKRALVVEKGSITRAAKLVGVDHKTIAARVKEAHLEDLRNPTRKTRRKHIIKH